MKRLAEMIRRAENGRRIRLTRRGDMVAFIVPKEDVERLEWLEEQERLYRESEQGEDGAPMEDYDEPAFAEPQNAQEPEAGEAYNPYAVNPAAYEDYRQRSAAISRFRKGFDRVIGASEVLSRSEITRRLKPDGYIASALLSIIGEG